MRTAPARVTTGGPGSTTRPHKAVPARGATRHQAGTRQYDEERHTMFNRKKVQRPQGPLTEQALRQWLVDYLVVHVEIPREDIDTAKTFEAYGLDVWIPELGGRFDNRNASHKMLMSVSGGMSESERQHVQARVRAAMDAQVVNEGRHQGGRAPYGYTVVDGGPHPNPRKAAEGHRLRQLAVDEPSAEIVRRIFAEYLDGRGDRAISVRLNLDPVGVAAKRAAWFEVVERVDLRSIFRDTEEFIVFHEPLVFNNHRIAQGSDTQMFVASVLFQEGLALGFPFGRGFLFLLLSEKLSRCWIRLQVNLSPA